eukprot:SAG31_NODE_874_length_11319_cov_3.145098_9_plen_178_part_00
MSMGWHLLFWQLMVAVAAAARSGPDQCPTVGSSLLSAQQLCAGLPVAESLRAIGIRHIDAEDTGGVAPSLPRLLNDCGFITALDLQLLDADGSEAVELMQQLRESGLSIGDRSKVRLLFGDPGRSGAFDQTMGRTAMHYASDKTPLTAAATDLDLLGRRQLQDMSVDTVHADQSFPI